MKYQEGKIFKNYLLKSQPQNKILRKKTKEVKDLHTENYKTLIKETEDDSKKEMYLAPGLEKLILLKWPYYSK